MTQKSWLNIRQQRRGCENSRKCILVRKSLVVQKCSKIKELEKWPVLEKCNCCQIRLSRDFCKNVLLKWGEKITRFLIENAARRERNKTYFITSQSNSKYDSDSPTSLRNLGFHNNFANQRHSLPTSDGCFRSVATLHKGRRKRLRNQKLKNSVFATQQDEQNP